MNADLARYNQYIYRQNKDTSTPDSGGRRSFEIRIQPSRATFKLRHQSSMQPRLFHILQAQVMRFNMLAWAQCFVPMPRWVYKAALDVSFNAIPRNATLFPAHIIARGGHSRYPPVWTCSISSPCKNSGRPESVLWRIDWFHLSASEEEARMTKVIAGLHVLFT